MIALLFKNSLYNGKANFIDKIALPSLRINIISICEWHISNIILEKGSILSKLTFINHMYHILLVQTEFKHTHTQIRQKAQQHKKALRRVECLPQNFPYKIYEMWDKHYILYKHFFITPQFSVHRYLNSFCQIKCDTNNTI